MRGSTEKVYVADSGNHRIQVFTAKGGCLGGVVWVRENWSGLWCMSARGGEIESVFTSPLTSHSRFVIDIVGL